MSKIGLLFLESLSSAIGGIMYNQNVTISASKINNDLQSDLGGIF